MKMSIQELFAGVISALVMLGFFGAMALSFFHPMPDNQFTGALTVAFGAVVQYWVGSSKSSQIKDATIAGLTAQQPALLAAQAPH